MLVEETNESDEDVHDGEGHERDVRRMPGVVVAGRSRRHDVGQFLDDLPLQCGRNFAITFVPDHVLRGHKVAGSSDELDREGGGRWCSFVG